VTTASANVDRANAFAHISVTHGGGRPSDVRDVVGNIAATRIPETVIVTAGSCQMSVLLRRWCAEVSRYWARSAMTVSCDRSSVGAPRSAIGIDILA
jgi:hypothetical protein